MKSFVASSRRRGFKLDNKLSDMTSAAWTRFGFLSGPEEDDEEEEEEEESSAAESEGGWIRWFCRLDGHEFFCEVRPTS